ncbi:alpha/beta fold hydrolase [Aureispira anguillae]|uniref:Alpha/beta hydrolase n=1 Tax=Aureispira anguillae TaxID=2864201 RepID=A0A916DQM8_9BACT|nr:alpha/beta hydrolase [Aureispira anguillae]BDS10180.1 alpha/beta hydrolase [Aureispira anguillae]
MNNNKIVYFISGLGADERVFAQLDLPRVQMVYINWVKPELEDSLSSYAAKLLEQVDLNQEVVLVGLSFGGMLAVELSQLIPNCKTILLSSAATAKAIPRIYKTIGKCKIPQLLPFFIFRQANFFSYYFFGVKAKPHQLLLKEVLFNTDEHFFRWAIDAILGWKSEVVLPNLIQIHGTKDRILPLIEDSEMVIIPNGGHFMVLEQADLVSKALQKVLLEK